MSPGTKQTKRKKRKNQKSRRTPLAAFFAQFESFSFDENQSSDKNLDRLIKVLRCDVQDPDRREVCNGFKDALIQEFNERFGNDGNNISNWQNLCRVLRVDPVPDSIEACRQRVWDTRVNLVDLVDSARTGKPAKLFPTLGELTAYTLQEPEKFFPKENVYQGGKELLKEITDPHFGKRRNGSAKREERKKKQKAARAAVGGDLTCV
ncbi:uncharacterized protein F5147DRAFT_685225 [Suillus discolor]|uniref:Uncharacterized protein n=1 Tax=Suillus discolor TaxID=1912936 RepID=A0A9P7FA44_9AGAM|nr:uncharacterized protein F5147DRAFT_685225 [Suillus discolor]KAG2111984.1 hypothetical protein F5147DRAFT_685225 [Suillus discolor]